MVRTLILLPIDGKLSRMPKVSLVIPAYNAEGYLDATLKSVSAQGIHDFECIVVDDCSTDGTLGVAKKWRSKDRRIRIVLQRTNSGVSAARNTGLRMARSSLVCFLDSDDLLMSDSLDLRLQAYYQAVHVAGNDAAKIAGSYCASEKIEEGITIAPKSSRKPMPPVGFITKGGQCPFNCNQPMIRSDVLREVGGFNEALEQAEDYDLWSRILRAGYWFAPAHHVAVTYRARQQSVVRQNPNKHLHKSLALHDFANIPLAPEALGNSPFRLRKAYSDYSHQSGKAARILQFVGMELASTDPRPIEEIRDDISTHLPDWRNLFADSSRINQLISDGIQRQVSGPISPENNIKLDALLTSLWQSQEGIQIAETAETKNGPFGIEAEDRLWHKTAQEDIDLLFLPHKDYHVWTIGLAAEALQHVGIKFAVVDLSAQWRDGGVRTKAAELGLPLISYGEIALGLFAPRLFVTFNDWDYVTRPILIAAKEAGIPTAAIVEGIQDYDDVDTGRVRHAYKVAESVLLPGEFDKRYFDKASDLRLFVSGIPRIQHLRKRLSVPPKDENAKRVLINSNFSHNVLTEHRDQWLQQVVEAVLKAGFVPLISRHPEDKGTLFPEYLSSQDFYASLDESVLSIQRFASGILESLAVNVPVIYFNPHGEKIDKFSADPMGAYPVSTDPQSLFDYLQSLDDWRETALECAPLFLDQHTGRMDEDCGSQIARALEEIMGPLPSDAQRLGLKVNLQVIDRITDSLTRRENVFEVPETAVQDLRDLVKREKQSSGGGLFTGTYTFDENGHEILEGTKGRLAGFRKTSIKWRVRLMLHEALRKAYSASARFPWFHNRLRRLGEYYMRNFSPH